jgi:Mrp family chromosome partitioning ATPase
VILVEADLHKESTFRFSASYTAEGLSGILVGIPLEHALMQVPVSAVGPKPPRALTVLPSGPMPPNPSELLESEQMRAVLTELEQRFDFVVIDSPAIGIVSDAMALVPLASAILAVGGIGKTTREGGRRFAEQLTLTGSRPLGLIATFTPADRNQYAYYRQSRALFRR